MVPSVTMSSVNPVIAEYNSGDITIGSPIRICSSSSENSFNAEVDYGVKLGLKSAKKVKKSGKSIEDLDFDKDIIPEGSGGSLAPGSDSGWPIDGDNQKWSKSGGWR